MAYISKTEAQDILAPFVPTLRTSIFEAWDQALKVPNRHQLEPRTKSSMVRDLIVAKVKEKFASIPGATLIETRYHFFLRIQKFLIRFKKLDVNRLPQNYRTKQAVALEAQELDLPGIEGAIYLNAGYNTDATGTKILSAFLTCQRNRSNDWELPLGGAEHGLAVIPIQQSFDDETMIRPRKDLVRKEQASEISKT